ncbi:MAG TPA: error-prone DNA polymerase, partial [Acidimicrobiales bacterium]
MSHKRSGELMAGLRARLFAGMDEKRVPKLVQDDIVERLSSFTSFGFPESHALSFAALVYSSAWLKLHYPAAFTAGLLNAQPMGFWSSQSLLADAKRHGVVVHRPDVNASAVGARPVTSDPDHPAIRLGLASVRTVGEETAARLVAGQPWRSQEELVRRGGLTRPQLEALALAGALDQLSGDHRRSRRRLVWTAGAAAQSTPGHLPGIVTGASPPPLPVPSPLE